MIIFAHSYFINIIFMALQTGDKSTILFTPYFYFTVLSGWDYVLSCVIEQYVVDWTILLIRFSEESMAPQCFQVRDIFYGLVSLRFVGENASEYFTEGLSVKIGTMDFSEAGFLGSFWKEEFCPGIILWFCFLLKDKFLFLLDKFFERENHIFFRLSLNDLLFHFIQKMYLLLRRDKLLSLVIPTRIVFVIIFFNLFILILIQHGIVLKLFGSQQFIFSFLKHRLRDARFLLHLQHDAD